MGYYAVHPDTVGSPHVIDGAIATCDIADGAVTCDKIAPAAVESGHIAYGAIDGGHIVCGAITGDHLCFDTCEFEFAGCVRFDSDVRIQGDLSVEADVSLCCLSLYGSIEQSGDGEDNCFDGNVVVTNSESGLCSEGGLSVEGDADFRGPADFDDEVVVSSDAFLCVESCVWFRGQHVCFGEIQGETVVDLMNAERLILPYNDPPDTEEGSVWYCGSTGTIRYYDDTGQVRDLATA